MWSGRLSRIGAVIALTLVGWVVACAGDPTCEAGFNTCGDLCCSTECQADKTCKPNGAGTSSGGGISSGTTSSGGTVDPECRKEVFPTHTKFCGGKCIDVSFDSENCGACNNACGTDTNDIPISCQSGKCGRS